MPLNIMRLNQRKLHPNEHIVFIKPLPGPDAAIAEDFLSRIAAQCFPIMRANHLSVTTLEEYEPNREFVGRNFNAGEVVQLVLKSPGTGRWLPFRYVQMVMMHELAHCMQMNHSRAFWAVRNAYAGEMRGLWAKGYTGEGMWGKGRQLYDGQIAADASLDGEDVPEHLCGGTYRSRRKKRSAKAELSYQEKKERRIRNKFGPGGEKLGEDELMRRGLEKNKWNPTKPRVAKSKRGRELRAAALLDRLEKAKHESQSDQLESQDDDCTESEYESDADTKSASIDRNGTLMIKVCEDGNMDGSEDALQELSELNALPVRCTRDGSVDTDHESSRAAGVGVPLVSADIKAEEETLKRDSLTKIPHSATQKRPTDPLPACRSVPEPSKYIARQAAVSKPTTNPAPTLGSSQDKNCNVCSMSNSADALLCTICANVLDTQRLTRYWHCQSNDCQDSDYINAEDAGRCGVCGAAKP